MPLKTGYLVDSSIGYARSKIYEKISSACALFRIITVPRIPLAFKRAQKIDKTCVRVVSMATTDPSQIAPKALTASRLAP